MRTTEFGMATEIDQRRLLAGARRGIRRFVRAGMAALIATLVARPRGAGASRDAFYSAALRG
jgi:hypothetical protein